MLIMKRTYLERALFGPRKDDEWAGFLNELIVMLFGLGLPTEAFILMAKIVGIDPKPIVPASLLALLAIMATPPILRMKKRS